MKASELFVPSGYKSAWLSYSALAVIALAEFIVLWIISSLQEAPSDGITYFIAADDLLAGKVNIGRTPVYPLILAFLRAVFGAGVNVAVILLQFATFLASAYFLRKLCTIFRLKERVTFWVVAIYLLWPGTIGYCPVVLTETFSVCGVLFMLWFLAKSAVEGVKIADVLRAGFWLVFLIFLRPVFVYLVVAFLIYYGALIFVEHTRQGRLASVAGIAVAFAALGMVGVYKAEVTKTYGIASFSNISTINNYYLIRTSGLLSPELAQDSTFRSILSTFEQGDVHNSFDKILAEDDILRAAKISPVAFEAYVNSVIAANPAKVVQGALYRWSHDASGAAIMPSAPQFPIYVLERFIAPSISAFWLFFIVFTAMALRQWHRSKRLPAQSLIYLLVAGGLVGASILGAMNDWPRLCMPVFPVVLLLVGKFASLYRRNPAETIC